MAAKNDPQMPDIAFGLSQLGKEISAADLVRSEGQSKKVKVISEKKLMAWIESILNQQRAGQIDAMSDEEKQELLAKVQLEIQRRMKAEGEAAKLRDRQQADLEAAQARLASSQKSQADYEAAIAAYKAQIEQRDKTIEELQQDTFELQDQLTEKANLLQSTIAEKDRDKEKLQHSLRNQMVRSTSLLEGVIGLDNEYYGERHQQELPASDSANAEEQFYHDFDVGAAIIATLAKDLARLREIAGPGDGGGQLLEGDLALLAQLKAGSLNAMDVASPVASLVEAVENARSEAQALEVATNEATGLPAPAAPLSQVPEADGDPAEVIAGATQVVRELESLLARERARLGALKSMADEADAARNAGENELESMRLAYDDLVRQVAAKAADAAAEVPAALSAQADPQVKALEAQVATQVRDLGRFIAADDAADPALGTQVKQLDGLVAKVQQDHDAVESGDLLRGTQATLDALKREIARRDARIAAETEAASDLQARLATAEGALEAARATQVNNAALLRDLGQTVFAEDTPAGTELTGSYSVGQTRVADLDRTLSSPDLDAAALAASTKAVLEALRKDAAKHREKAAKAKAEVDRLDQENRGLHDRIDDLTKQLADASARADELLRSERELSQQLIQAAQGDEQMAEIAADLAITIDDQDSTVSDLNAHSKLAVAKLIERKQQLEAELNAQNEKSAELNTRAIARSKGMEAEIARLAAEVAAQAATAQAAQDELATLKAKAEEERAEAAETAASAKEIIQQLRSQHESRDAELAVLREKAANDDTELADLRQRAAGAEAANKLLGDTLMGLSRLAEGEAELEGAREALDHALGELPGEAGIALRPESAQRIAKAAQGLLGTMALRRSELGESEAAKAQELAEAIAQREVLVAEAAQAKARVLELERELQDQSADAVETAATAKEMIQALQSQVAGRDEKVRESRAAEERLSAELSQTKARAEQVDQANRQLAEALAELTSAELATAPDLGQLDGIEEARVDLELVLSELPVEGETGVAVSADIGPRLAEAGAKAAAALAARRKAISDDLSASRSQAQSLSLKTSALEQELAVLRKTVSERDSNLKRQQAELEATRSEVKDQAQQLAAKTQDLSAARSRLASLESEVEDLRGRVSEQDQALATASAAAQRAITLEAEVAGLRASDEQSRAAVARLVEAVGSLGRWDDPQVASLVAAKGGSLAKASDRLAARDDRNPEQAAVAAAEVVEALREEVVTLGAALLAAREGIGEQQRAAAALREELSSARTNLVSREQERDQAESEAANAKTAAEAAAATAAILATALARIDDSDAGKVLAEAAEDPQRLSDLGTQARAVAEAAVARTETLQAEREQLAGELAAAQTSREDLRHQLDRIKGEVAERTREADEARASQQALATTASGLGRDLLSAAKAAAADVDPENSAEAAKALEGFDQLTPERQVSVAVAFMPTLREIITNLALAQAETQGDLEAERERKAQEAALAGEALAAARAEARAQADALAAAQAERERMQQELEDARRAIASAEEHGKSLDDQLLQAQAELDDFRARGSLSSGASAEHLNELKSDLDEARKRLSATEAALSEATHKLESTEARMQKSREELSARLAERDQLIVEKTREVEELAARHSDTHALEAKVEALSRELGEAHDQLKQYRQVHGDLHGASAQAGDLRKALKQAETEREQLRAKLRDLEGELADRKGELEEASAATASKQKELASLRSKKDQEIEAERQALAKARESERQLKEENVGLKARLRRLTER